jgi:hypothetical protein
MKKLTIYGVSMAMSLCSCHSAKQASAQTTADVSAGQTEILPQAVAATSVRGTAKKGAQVRSPKVFVYKLRNDEMYDHVPVSMNNERTAIVSYPAPTDLSVGGVLQLPSRLTDGYLLDNRGITPTVAFLDYTYEEYSRLTETPTASELMEHIADISPLLTWRYMGRRSDYTDIVAQINEKLKAEGTEK